MRISTYAPLALAGLMAVMGIVAVASPAAAQPNHWSDTEFLSASRCAGIAEGLGGDTKTFDKMLDQAADGREFYIVQQGQTARQDGERLAHRNDADMKAKVAAERDGVCKAYIG